MFQEPYFGQVCGVSRVCQVDMGALFFTILITLRKKLMRFMKLRVIIVFSFILINSDLF